MIELVLADFGIAALVVGIIGTAGSFVMSQKQQKQQEKAAALELQRSNLQKIQQQRRARAKALAAEGETVQGGANQGATTSSAITGGVGGQRSGTNQQLTFLDQTQSISNKVFAASTKAAKYGAQAGLFGAVGSIGLNVASSSKSVQNLFGGGGGNKLSVPMNKAPAPDSFWGSSTKLNQTIYQ